MEALLLIPTAILAFLLYDEKKTNRQERQELLNRIQAPAVYRDPGFEDGPQYIPFDDDKAFAELTRGDS